MANYEDSELDQYDDTEYPLDTVSDDEDDLSYPEDSFGEGPGEDEEDEPIEIEDDDDDQDVRPFVKTKSRKPSEDKQKEDKPEKKKVGNVFAALRVTQRQNEILQGRLERVLAAINNAQNQKEDPEEEPEEIIPYETDPVGHLNAKQNILLEKIDKQEKEAQARKEQEKVLAIADAADDAIAQYREQVGADEYAEAMKFLVTNRVYDLQEAHPELTNEEIGKIIVQQAWNEKIRLQSQGRNPAEVFYNYAKRHGYRSQMKRKSQDDEPDARRAIKRVKDRDGKSRTVASVHGKPARTKMNADDFVGMSEDDFDDYLTNIEKEQGKRRGTLGIADILQTSRGK